MITLKKYKYDYLVYQTGNGINYKIVCYVDTFDIDTSSKKLIDPLPDNVNMQKDLREKSNVVFTKAVREMVSNVLNNNFDNNQLSAKNFILHSYKSFDTKNKSIFELLKSSISKEGSLFLLKSKISLDNIGYLFDDNDSKTNFILKSFTWKKIYASLPSMKYKKLNDVFESSKYPLNTLIEKVSDPNFEPQFFDMNVEVNEMTISKFLSKKVKRQTDDEYLKEKQIPERIKDLMSKYGDVLATISKNDIDKYKKYRIYSEITN